jgi:hypothetical protein
VSRAYGAVEPPWYVMGLIAGWGTVAMHGREGFRAERAAMKCLFTDWSWNASKWHGSGGLSGWWHRTRGPAAEPEPPVPVDPDLGRADALREVAARYGVPLVSLRRATSLGLLSEWEIPRAQIEEARRLGTSNTFPEL